MLDEGKLANTPAIVSITVLFSLFGMTCRHAGKRPSTNGKDLALRIAYDNVIASGCDVNLFVTVT